MATSIKNKLVPIVKDNTSITGSGTQTTPAVSGATVSAPAAAAMNTVQKKAAASQSGGTSGTAATQTGGVSATTVKPVTEAQQTAANRASLEKSNALRSAAGLPVHSTGEIAATASKAAATNQNVIRTKEAAAKTLADQGVQVSRTTYIDDSGNKKTGFIVNGRTYQDAAGLTPVNVGSRVAAGDGREYIKTENGSMLYSDWLKQQGTETGSAPAAAGQETAYSPYMRTENGRYEGFSTVSRTYQPNEYGSVEVTIRTPSGQEGTGYMLNGRFYSDPQGTQLLDGVYAEAPDGKIYRASAAQSRDQLVWSPNQGDYYDYASAYPQGRSISYTGSDGKTYYVEGDPVSGNWVVYDANHNSLGRLDNTGAAYSSSNTMNNPVYQPAFAGARDALIGNGVDLNGDGTVKLASGSEANFGKIFNINSWSQADAELQRRARAGDTAAAAQSDALYADMLRNIDAVYSQPIGSAAAQRSGTVYADAARGAAQQQTSFSTGNAAPQPGVQQRDMLATEAERQRQAQEQAAEAERQRQAQLQQMTPRDNAQMQQLRDQLAQVDALLESARTSGDEAYALQLQQVRARIQEQIASLNEQYQGVNRQLYVDYMMAQRDLPQQLAAQGYTGGLRESSMLGLRAGYEGQLAENERQRLAGIRDLESGGLDKELTLGIENIKDRQQAEETAYNRAAAVRAQMLQQMNRIEDLSRSDAETARKEAQTQINAYLSAGGSAQEIPSALLTISGYTGAYVSALAGAYARQQAQAQANAILSAGGSIPDTIAQRAGYGLDYTAALDAARAEQRAQEISDREAQWAREDAQRAEQYARNDEDSERKRAQGQVDAILSAGGTVPPELLEAAGYGAEYAAALGGYYQRAEADKTRQEAQAQANAILAQGGTVPPELLAAAGYSTEYADALRGQSKPTLTLAQVEAAIKAGNLSPNVLSAYEYYYGRPYQQTAQQTYYTGNNPGTSPTPTGESQATATFRSAAQNILSQSGIGNYEDVYAYANARAAAGAISYAEAMAIADELIGTDIANKVNSGVLTKEQGLAYIATIGR